MSSELLSLPVEKGWAVNPEERYYWSIRPGPAKEAPPIRQCVCDLASKALHHLCTSSL